MDDLSLAPGGKKIQIAGVPAGIEVIETCALASKSLMGHDGSGLGCLTDVAVTAAG